MRVIAVESAAQFVQHGRTESTFGPGQRDGLSADVILRGEVAVAGERIAGPGRVLPVDSVVAEAAEDAVVLRSECDRCVHPRSSVSLGTEY